MLEAHGLRKWYAGVAVLDGVSFSLRPGEVTGYLGPNGAGKSTTARILTGLLQPSEGRVCWNGCDIGRNLTEYKSRLGYVPEEPLVYPFLTGREYLQLIGRLRGMPDRTLHEKIDALMTLFSLRRFRNTALSCYSKGMQQKVLLSAALLHNPDVLVLDEPLSGLDVTSSLVVRSLIRELAHEGKVILFSSHVLELVEKVCARVIILHKGSLVADGSVDDLRAMMDLGSLEEVFSQLVIREDTDRIARDIVEVMRFG